MLFNSWLFIKFFAIVYVAVWLLTRFRAPVGLLNAVLLVASYVFYGAWHVWYLGLILLSTGVDYFIGLQLGKTTDPGKRMWLAGTSIVVNLGVLGFFKYFDFGIENLSLLLQAMGLTPHLSTLEILLPVGISFYTFQTISYTIDVYRKKIEPHKNLLDFALFVAFFPQLVAGPIERAGHMLPQLSRPRAIGRSDISIGLFYIISGYFKKTVIADSLAPLVEHTFQQVDSISGAASLSGVFAFSLQIYGDFAGYSFIAIGLARLMGIRLTQNFNTPYFSSNPRELWKRWHISLSSWFKDYLYLPLGGSRKGRTYVNLLAVMAISGLWHGAAWGVILWGIYHGILVMLHRWFGRDFIRVENKRVSVVMNTLLIYLLWVYGMLFFRAENIDQILAIHRNIFTNFTWHAQDWQVYMMPVIIWHLVLMAYHGWQRANGDQLVLRTAHPLIRLALIPAMLWMIMVLGFRDQPFIYFQF